MFLLAAARGPEVLRAAKQAVAQGRLDHLIDIWSPWWISAPLTGLCSQPSPTHVQLIPPIASLCKAPPSPSVGNVLVACACCYAVLMRVWNGEPDASMAHAMVSACKFLSKQEAASLQLHSPDSVLNDCFSCLCDAAVGLSRAAIPAAIADLLCIFASRHFILSALSVPPPTAFRRPCCCASPHLPLPHFFSSGCSSFAAAERAAQGFRLRLAQGRIFAFIFLRPQ